MTEINFFGNAALVFGILYALCDENGKTIVVTKQNEGHLKVNIQTDLSVLEKTIAQKILDAHGYGVIT